MNQKPTRRSSRLGTLTAFVTAIGVVLISTAPARADHHHHGHHHHHGSDFGLFFGLPLPVPGVVYEPRVYSVPPPASYDPAPQRPDFDEGHWRHEDGWDRRDEHGEWPHDRGRGDD